MEIRESQHGAVTILKPIGPLAASELSGFREHLLAAIERHLGRIVLDASAVPFADSAGLEALADVADYQSEHGGILRLCGVSDTVREALELTNLSRQFDFYAGEVDAARSFLG